MSFAPVINTRANGLLKALGLESGGKNPSELGGTVSPVVDLWDCYMSARSRSVTATFNITAVGGAGVVIPVPAGELWWVDFVGVTLPVLGAGQSIRSRAALNNSVQQLTYVGPAGSATVGERLALSFDRFGFLVDAGSGFGVFTESLVAGPINGCGLTVTYTPLTA